MLPQYTSNCLGVRIRDTWKKNPNIEEHTELLFKWFENHLHKLDESCWKALSSNPGAIHLLERHPHQINWKSLVNNPQASRLLEKEIINNNPLIIRNIAMIARNHHYSTQTQLNIFVLCN